MNCTIKGCENKLMCRGMCSMHYYRVKRGGTPLVSKKQQQALRKCEALGCDKPHVAKGLCDKHYMEKRRADSPQLRTKGVEWTRLWKDNNKEKAAAQQSRYRQAHLKELKAYFKAWRTENKESFRAYLKSRKKRVRQATPPWADQAALRNFYMKCPKGYHVDHIIPLRGKNISGLHIVENLQYLPALENLRKGNKFAA